MPSITLKAILWDGQKQLRGKLLLGRSVIQFQMIDFADTDLGFEIAYNEILKIDYYQLYGLRVDGLELKMINGGKNIFIVEEPQKVKGVIESFI